MAETLKIKNFGPIVEAEIDVKDMMVFIGAQSSGKSTLAKLITILNDFNFRQKYSSSLIEELEKYNLKSFLKKTTSISYNSPFFRFSYHNGKEEKFDYTRILNVLLSKPDPTSEEIELIRLVIGMMIRIIYSDGKSHILLRELQKDEYFGLLEDKDNLLDYHKLYEYEAEEITDIVLEKYEKDINIHELNELARQVTRVFAFIRPLDSLYIPSERTILPLVVNNIAGLINNKVQFPKYVLQTVQEFEKALQKVENFDLEIIGKLRFKRIDGNSYIYHNHTQKVLLREASSGVQSILPILLLIESSVNEENYINLNYVVKNPS